MKLNHVLIRTEAMDPMISFFVHVIGLELGFRPTFAFEGAWLYSEGMHLIHLIQTNENDQEQLKYLDRNQSCSGTGIIDHIAFQGADYNDLLHRLVTYKVHYTIREVPLTKELQIFIHGPEALIIEMIFPQ